jgi:hypothetical protein
MVPTRKLPSRLHHTAYTTKDMEKPRAFYEEVCDPPGKPIDGGVSSSLVIREGSACAERYLAGAHGTSPVHARVCHRDPRPRLPTTCREVLRERRTPARNLQDRSRVWRARLASPCRARERTADGARQARP